MANLSQLLIRSLASRHHDHGGRIGRNGVRGHVVLWQPHLRRSIDKDAVPMRGLQGQMRSHPGLSAT